MSGGAGNDTIWITKGVGSYLAGDLGSDSIYFADTTLSNSTVYGGNLSDATSADGADTLWIAGTVSSSKLQANGGSDTIYVGGTALSSDVVGGQGSDSLTIVGTVSKSLVSGNLGNDTIDLTAAAKSSTVYGGGGFLYDTSLDGADSIEIGGNLTGSLAHGNGGNDSFYLAAQVQASTVYGGQGNDLIQANLATGTATSSWLAGNRGADTISFSGTHVMNSTVLGSDITGTLAGNDSLSLGAATIQTSTVYGGAGNDTIFFGATNTSTQVVAADFNAFAGADSISAVVLSSAALSMPVPAMTRCSSTHRLLVSLDLLPPPSTAVLVLT